MEGLKRLAPAARQFASSYVALVAIAVICNGVVARIYGNACGIGLADVFDLWAWGRVLGLTSSPLCSMLLKLCQMAQMLSDYAWANIFTHMVLAVGAAVPALSKQFSSLTPAPRSEEVLDS